MAQRDKGDCPISWRPDLAERNLCSAVPTFGGDPAHQPNAFQFFEAEFVPVLIELEAGGA